MNEEKENSEVVDTNFVQIEGDVIPEGVQELTTTEDLGQEDSSEDTTAKEEVIIPAEYGSIEWHNLVSELNTLGVLMSSTYQQPKFTEPTKKKPQGELLRTVPQNIYSPMEIYRMKQKADKIMQKLGW